MTDSHSADTIHFIQSLPADRVDLGEERRRMLEEIARRIKEAEARNEPANHTQ